MKLIGYRKYIFTLLFLLTITLVYFNSKDTNKLELYYDCVKVLALAGVGGSVGEYAAKRFNKNENYKD